MSSSDSMSFAPVSLPPLVTESTTPFTFNLDHIKRHYSTPNYLSCGNQVSDDLHMMDIYQYVERSTTNPTDTRQLATWTRNDYTAKAAIISFLSEDFIYLASNTTIVKNTWKAVEDHRDSRNSSTLQ